MRKKLAALLMITMITAEGTTVLAAPIDVPEDVRQISVELGTMYDICPEVIQATCFKESSFNPLIENGGCIGIMQVNPEWHADRMDRLGVTDLYDTRSCMMAGSEDVSEYADEILRISAELERENGK